jgi:hypothetical protein
MDVRSFKLVNGQELIADLVAVTGRGYSVKNPLVLHVLKGQDGKEMLAFAKWSIVHKEGQPIELLDAALAAAPVAILDEISDSYIQQTSSLILPPSKAAQILLS